MMWLQLTKAPRSLRLGIKRRLMNIVRVNYHSDEVNKNNYEQESKSCLVCYLSVYS